EALSIFKKTKSIYEQAKLPLGYKIFTGAIGFERPVVIGTVFARSASEYAELYDNLDDEMKNKLKELKKQLLKICRKVIIKYGRPRPDLSYFQEK
ncbi:hypothetical protein BVY01_00860, partial [bacterium I07]